MKYFPIVLLFLLCPVCSAVAQTEPQLTKAELSKLTYRVCDKLTEAPDRALFQKFELAIAADPKNYELYFERAKCFKRLDDYDAVMQDVSEVLTLKKDHYSTFWSQLSDLFWSKEHVERRKRVDYLIANNVDHFFPYQMRALDKMSIKDYKGAYEDYMKAAEMSPLNSIDRYGILGTALHVGLKDDKDIIEYFGRAFSFYEATQRDFLSRVERKDGDFSTLGRMKEFNLWIGNILDAWSTILADLYLQKGELQKSDAVLETMVTIYPVPMAYEFRSSYYKRKGDLEKAEADRIKGIEASIDAETKIIENSETDIIFRSGAYIYRGDLRLKLNRYESAITDYQTAKAIFKPNTDRADAKIEAAKQKMAQENPQPK